MKAFLRFLAIAALLAVCHTARAQYDTFGDVRTVIIAQPTNVWGTGAATLNTGGANYTNRHTDLTPFEGIVRVDIAVLTNTVGTFTLLLQNSSDQTAWSTFTNYAIGNPTQFILTNVYYGSNLTCTNIWLLPGTNTTVTAATAGFQGNYLTAAPFTNSGTLTVGNLPLTIGFRRDDAPRYFRFILQSTGGASTNASVQATLTGKARTYLIP